MLELEIASRARPCLQTSYTQWGQRCYTQWGQPTEVDGDMKLNRWIERRRKKGENRSLTQNSPKLPNKKWSKIAFFGPNFKNQPSIML